MNHFEKLKEQLTWHRCPYSCDRYRTCFHAVGRWTKFTSSFSSLISYFSPPCVKLLFFENDVIVFLSKWLKPKSPEWRHGDCDDAWVGKWLNGVIVSSVMWLVGFRYLDWHRRDDSVGREWQEAGSSLGRRPEQGRNPVAWNRGQHLWFNSFSKIENEKIVN